MLFNASKTSLSKMALLAVLALASSAPAANLTESTAQFDEAAKAYRDKKYSVSLTQFQKLHDTGRCNDFVHYYIALCDQSLNQIASAKQEYALLARSKNASLRAYSRYAVASLDSWNQHRQYQGNGNIIHRSSSGRRPGAPPRLSGLPEARAAGPGC